MSNNVTIEKNKEVALVKLNKTWQVPEQINIIKYYTESGGIDFLFAIGKASGFGPEFYSMVQAHEETLVLNISNRLSDVSTLVYDQKVLCYCNPDSKYLENKWYMITDTPGPGDQFTRNFTKLTEPAIYRNLDDGFRWFFVNDVLKREDDFINSTEAGQLVDQNIEYFKKPTIDIDLQLPNGTVKGGTNYYLPQLQDTTIEKPHFTIRITNYRGEDETDKYTISLKDGDYLERIGETNEYIVWRVFKNDFKLQIQATKNALTTEETVYVWYPEIMYYGTTILNNDTPEPLNVNPRKIYHNLETLDLEYTLQRERSILIIPPGFAKFVHIYDINGLDYINDYTYLQEFSYQNSLYQVYYKNSEVTIEKLRQKFTYSNDIVDLTNTQWETDSGPDNYYTKAEVDELFNSIVVETNIINDNLVLSNKTWSSMKLNPVYEWATGKINSEIANNFTVTIKSTTGQTYYTDQATQTTMTVTVQTKYSGTLVQADSTPSGWDALSTVGEYQRSITGASGTIGAQTFTYTKNGIPISKSSPSRSINAINPAWWGMVPSNDPTIEITNSIFTNYLTHRLTTGYNQTIEITNPNPEISYLWILTKNTANATQFGGLSLFNGYTTKSFTSINNLPMTGYKLYIATNSAAANGTYGNVTLTINL